MLETNAAYLVTPGVTHIVIWTQDMVTKAQGQGLTWTTEVVALCGRKKKHLKRSELVYPDAQTPTKRVCVMCADVLSAAMVLGGKLKKS